MLAGDLIYQRAREGMASVLFEMLKYAAADDFDTFCYPQSVFTVVVFIQKWNNTTYVYVYIPQHYNERIVLQNFSTLSVSCRAISVIISSFLMPMEILPSTPASCNTDMARCLSRSLNNPSSYTQRCINDQPYYHQRGMTHLQHGLHSCQRCESRDINLGIKSIGNIHVIQYFVLCRCANDQKTTILIGKG